MAPSPATSGCTVGFGLPCLVPPNGEHRAKPGAALWQAADRPDDPAPWAQTLGRQRICASAQAMLRDRFTSRQASPGKVLGNRCRRCEFPLSLRPPCSQTPGGAGHDPSLSRWQPDFAHLRQVTAIDEGLSSGASAAFHDDEAVEA